MTTLERLKQRKLDNPDFFSLTLCDLAEDLMQSGKYTKLPETAPALEAVQQELDFLEEDGDGAELLEPLAELLHVTETQGFINGLLMGLQFSPDFIAETFWDKYVLNESEEPAEE